MPKDLLREDVVDLENDVWSNLSPSSSDVSNISKVTKRKLVDTLKYHRRAVEDIDIVSSDMQRLVRSLIRQRDVLHIKMEQLGNKSSQYDNGTRSIITRKFIYIQMCIESVTSILNKANDIGIDIAQFVEEVENVHMPSVQQTDLSNDMVRELVSEIDSLEMDDTDEMQ